LESRPTGVDSGVDGPLPAWNFRVFQANCSSHPVGSWKSNSSQKNTFAKILGRRLFSAPRRRASRHVRMQIVSYVIPLMHTDFLRASVIGRPVASNTRTALLTFQKNSSSSNSNRGLIYTAAATADWFTSLFLTKTRLTSAQSCPTQRSPSSSPLQDDDDGIKAQIRQSAADWSRTGSGNPVKVFVSFFS
jgi:hypothetical protein